MPAGCVDSGPMNRRGMMTDGVPDIELDRDRIFYVRVKIANALTESQFPARLMGCIPFR